MRLPLDFIRIRKGSLSNIFGRVPHRKAPHHQGWDLAAKVGTPIYAITDGIIRNIGHYGAYGNQLNLEFVYKGQTLYAFYAHLSAIFVGNDQRVTEGTLLGLTGKSGNASKLPASEDHLHFEIRMWNAHPGRGLSWRIDPGTVLGFGVYSSYR